MSLASQLPIHVMASIVKNVDTKDFVNMQSVCKHWHALLQSDQVISIIMQRVFPHYSVRPGVSLMHQFRQLLLVPQNIANGVYSLRDVAIPKTSCREYVSPTHHVEVLSDTRMIVINRKTEALCVCDGHAAPTSIFSRIEMMDLQFTSDGKKMVTASTDSTLKVWDLDSGDCLMTLQGHRAPVHGVRLNSTGNRAYSFCADGVVKWWDLTTGECVHTYTLKQYNVRGIELSADQKKLYLFLRSGSIYTINEQNQVEVKEFNTQFLSSVKTPDGKWLIVSTPKSIIFFSSDALEIRGEIKFPEGIEHRAEDGGLHRTWITWMRFSQDQTKLIMRGYDSRDLSLYPFANELDFLKL